MDNNIPTVQPDRIQGTNVVQLRGHVFLGNTFRSREPRKEGPFTLAGRIKHRDQALSSHPVAAARLQSSTKTYIFDEGVSK